VDNPLSNAGQSEEVATPSNNFPNAIKATTAK
jgi:hypothetical protein